MRIGMITGEYPPMQGGVGAYTRILSCALADQGHELFILSRIETREDDPRLHLSASITRWNRASLQAARDWAQTNRLDLVNLQYQTAAYSMSPFIHFLPGALRPIPTITTFHDLRFPYLFPKAGFVRNWIVMRLARASAGVIATNHEDAARLRSLCSALIPVGSNITASADSPPARTDGEFQIVNFGLINRSKGIDTLLEAVARLHDESIPLRLILVGAVAGSSDPTNAAYAREIDAQIERLGLTPLIERTGYLDDAGVSQRLSAADVVALPFTDGASYRRGTLMAALQHGCAVVTTQPQVGIPAFIDGANLMLVRPRDPAALANALRLLHDAPDLRARLRAGAAQLSRQFEWGEIAQATVAFYQRVLGAQA